MPEPVNSMSNIYRYRILYCIFVLSGFAGLIYESIWSHYLKLFLGHAAYSQALVLSIFMGGMALGAWITGKTKFLYSRINLLYAYALVELFIGISGALFHDIYVVISDFSFNQIIPLLAEPWLVNLYKWGTGSLLILPQSIMLGMTFPLMTNGLIRLRPELPGRSISLLYFGNSIGAAIGVLVSGFFLIATTGMPGTLLTAGIINVFIAIVVYAVAKEQPFTAERPVPMLHSRIPYLMLAAAFLTGMASFIYELVWIRMLSMVLGASTHSFELMLSAFITGLAFGGLWIHNRIDRLGNPVYFAGIVQVLMGLAALGTLPLYNVTFNLMAFLLNALASNDSGYILFVLGSHAIAMLIMLPATFLAGMTLPLFTLILLRGKYGEKSISHVYVCNTVGAVCGVIFVYFIGMPVLGMQFSMLTGTAVDLLLGLLLLLYAGLGQKFLRTVVTASLVLFVIVFSVSDINPERITTAVFRTGISILPEERQVLFYKDGKTSTVTVTKTGDSLHTIATNGKPDGSVYMNYKVRDRSSSDEITEILIGAIPLAIVPQARKVAVIGLGTGLTSHVVLSRPDIERLDTIEIEEEMIAGARFFRPRNERVFTDPRSFIHVEDARTYFSYTREKYDLIISEPSNPWVGGVSSLFSGEFYEQIQKSLNDDGYLMQWMHVYEMDHDLLFAVLKALADHFDDFRIYATGDSDLVIVARVHGRVEEARDHIFGQNSMRAELAMVGINHIEDIHARYLANHRLLMPLINNLGVNSNSDFYPYLDLYAPRARFLRNKVIFLRDMKASAVPVARVIMQQDDPESTNITPFPKYSYSTEVWRAQKIYRQIVKNEMPEPGSGSSLYVSVEYLRNLAMNCAASGQRELWLQQLLNLAAATLPYLSSAELQELFNGIRPECPGGMPASQQRWLDLIAALIQHDFSRIVEITDLILPSPDGAKSQAHWFLLKARLLSLYMTSNEEEFARSFKKHMEKFRHEPLPFDVLILQALVNDMHK